MDFIVKLHDKLGAFSFLLSNQIVWEKGIDYEQTIYYSVFNW